MTYNFSRLTVFGGRLGICAECYCIIKQYLITHRSLIKSSIEFPKKQILTNEVLNNLVHSIEIHFELFHNYRYERQIVDFVPLNLIVFLPIWVYIWGVKVCRVFH